MDFGIVFPSYLDAWKDAAIAEDNGFTHAWFYDSQMLYSDVYACMALAAEHTRRIKGEERFLNERLIKRSTLTGPGEEIIARLKALEAAGLKSIAVQVVTNGRELIEEFSKEVIARYR